MRINGGKSYVQQETAIAKLTEKFEKNGLKLDEVRWLIMVNEDGRFVPTIIYDPYRNELLSLVHYGISVIG